MGLFADYPAVPGNKYHAIGEITGPASYTQISIATPPTGGISVTAAELGLVEIESIQFMGSDDGQYEVTAFPNCTGKGCTQVQLMVKVAATGAQATGTTNLSTRKFRYHAVGR